MGIVLVVVGYRLSVFVVVIENSVGKNWDGLDLVRMRVGLRVGYGIIVVEVGGEV